MNKKVAYDYFKNITTIYEKWNQTGLLEGILQMDKTNLALLLEKLSKKLGIDLSETYFTFMPEIPGLALPCMRRIFYYNPNYNYNDEFLDRIISDIEFIYIENNEDLENTEYYNEKGIDLQAELLSAYCDRIGEEIRRI